MQLSNTETIPGYETSEVLGVVRGNTVRARNLGRDVTQAIRNIFGGELKAYSTLLTQARDQAMKRMESQAEELGADAVVNVRFMTSQIAGSSAEILAYGTAVKLVSD